MTTPNLGNELDAIFKPEWLAIVHGAEALATNLEGGAKAELQSLQSELTTALSGAATQVQNAQSKIDAAVNPIVNMGIDAAAKAIEAAYPPIAPLIAGGEAKAQTLADAGTDAILLALINSAAGLLTAAGKSAAAVNLSNKAGAS